MSQMLNSRNVSGYAYSLLMKKMYPIASCSVLNMGELFLKVRYILLTLYCNLLGISFQKIMRGGTQTNGEADKK